MARAYTDEQFDQDQGDFMRMLSSYNPEHNRTYIDEGNSEMFIVEQVDGEGNVHAMHLTPNQAWELRQKLDVFLKLHFGPQHMIEDRKFIMPERYREAAQAA